MGRTRSGADARSRRAWLALSAADIQLSFAIQAARLLYGLEKFPNLAKFLDRIHARPAYKRAIERGGVYAFGS